MRSISCGPAIPEAGSAVQQQIDDLCLLAERIVPGTLATVMLLGAEECLRLYAGPSLTQELWSHFDGIPVIPGNGSCASAVMSGQVVLVSDVSLDERWLRLQDVAADLNIHACWSAPILDPLGKVVGSFALTSLCEAFAKPQQIALLRGVTSVISQILFQHQIEHRDRGISAVLRSVSEGVLLTDAEHRILYCNNAFAEITGYSLAELLGQNCRLLQGPETSPETIATIRRCLKQERRFEGKILNYRKDGSSFWNHLTITPIRDHHGRVVQYAGVQRDLGRESLARLVEGDDALLYDPLTALMNRRALEEELPRARIRADRSERLLAIVVIDLDDFKELNDRLGRDCGDFILQRIAKRLRKVLRHGDSIARFGGDEFILLLEGLRDLDQLESLLAKMTARLQRPIDLGGDDQVSIAMSVGASIYPLSHHDNLELLLREADQAMFEAKRNKSARAQPWAFWSSDDDRYPLRALFRAGALQAWYQPVWDQRRQQVVGIEALARLVDAQGKIYLPGEFLSQLAEEDLFQLTQQMLQRAVADLQRLDSLGWPLWVSVNIDPQLVGVTCVQFLQRLVAENRIEPRRIVLELLENREFADQTQALDWLYQLKGLGFQLALDDVGSGYSSLLRLKQLPIDKAKLDQGFIRTLEEHPRDLSFVQSVVDLARGLDIDLVAEGVESDAIRDAIGVLGMRYLQGYAIARPMSYFALQAFLAQQQSISAPLPPTLLSAYAFHLTHFSLLEKAFDHDPSLLDLVSLANADTCTEQQRLLALGLAPEHELFCLHAEYHQRIFGLREADGTASPQGWAQLEDCHRRFAAALLHAFQIRRGEGR